jgi:hypothetical protein
VQLSIGALLLEVGITCWTRAVGVPKGELLLVLFCHGARQRVGLYAVLGGFLLPASLCNEMLLWCLY